MQSYKNITEYIAAAPAQARPPLKQLRTFIQKLAPKAEERISYGIPTYKYFGNLVHFGGYKTHIGFYPGSAAIKKFAKELKGFKTAKGTVQFSLGKPLPLAIIKDIVKFRIRVNEENRKD